MRLSALNPGRYSWGQDQPRASHRTGLFSLNDPPRDHADLSGAFSQWPQGSGQKGAGFRPGL